MAEAGEAARGATIYVTLEPCSHFGATPPCAEAIVAAGVARVVCGARRPRRARRRPRIARLREAGIAVALGVGAKRRRGATIAAIFCASPLGRPMATLKLAMTADGYAAGDEHDARLAITGEAANGAVQVMRSLHDAIMVGFGTARDDDPLLTVRLPASRKSRCASSSTRARTAARFAPRRDRARISDLVVATAAAPAEREVALAATGVETARVAADPAGGVDLGAALRLLGQRGVTRVFSEGGPRVGRG